MRNYYSTKEIGFYQHTHPWTHQTTPNKIRASFAKIKRPILYRYLCGSVVYRDHPIGLIWNKRLSMDRTLCGRWLVPTQSTEWVSAYWIGCWPEMRWHPITRLFNVEATVGSVQHHRVWKPAIWTTINSRKVVYSQKLFVCRCHCVYSAQVVYETEYESCVW